MIPSRADEDAARLGRQAQLRSQLVAVCAHIADVEDGLASTLTRLAQTATKDRADRLLAHAWAARDYARKERARAERYAE